MIQIILLISFLFSAIGIGTSPVFLHSGVITVVPITGEFKDQAFSNSFNIS